MRGTVLAVFAAVLGAIVGSFLNACIHRMPRGIPLGNPKRSFCPSCKRMIPWYENLPLVSWLVLRGRCSGCGNPIPFRYFFVEAITAVAFFFAWQQFGLPLGPVYAVFLAILIAATFIDIEHFIIPDEITWGGTALGLLLSFAIPEMMQAGTHLLSLVFSFLGAALGYGMLWAIVEFGKLAFGRIRHNFKEPESFSISREGEMLMLRIGEESLSWEEIFSRESDKLIIDAPQAKVNGAIESLSRLVFHHDRLLEGSKETPIAEIRHISGTLTSVVIPREAMGFGDVKFIAAIGAFLGWKAVLFTICASSIIGSVAAIGGLFLARDKAGTRVPFGPFLALGAVIWIFWGEFLWNWYFARFSSQGDF